MSIARALWTALACAAACPVSAQESATLAGLRAQAATTLSRADLMALMPGAKVMRINEKGSTHIWTNEPGGEMIVSSDNRGSSGRSTTAQGKWSIGDDGRFCVAIQWKKGEPEDSCRFILKTADAYYATSELEPETRKAYKITIEK